MLFDDNYIILKNSSIFNFLINRLKLIFIISEFLNIDERRTHGNLKPKLKTCWLGSKRIRIYLRIKKIIKRIEVSLLIIKSKSYD